MKLSRISISILALFISLSTIAQEKDKNAIKYGKTIKVKDLKTHLNVLASDEMEGRETGEPGIAMASDYLVEQFKKLGIPEVEGYGYIQEYDLEKSKSLGVAIGETQNFTYIDDFVTFSKLSDNLHVDEFEFIGYGNDGDDFNEINGKDLTGKDVMVLAGEAVDQDGKLLFGQGEYSYNLRKDFPKKMSLASTNKVRSLFVVIDDLDATIKPFKSFFKESRLRLKSEEKVSTKNSNPKLIMISKSMAEQLMASSGLSLDSLKNAIVTKKKPASTSFKSFLTLASKEEIEEVKANNVLAFIEGSDLKDEVLVITAHFDHIGKHDGKVFNGADDDGSGTVGLIEIAEAFTKAKKAGKGPRRSILIMPVSGEEKGLLGSTYYASNPVFPMENTIANLNIDMIGRVDKAHKDNPNYIYIIGSNMLSTDLHDMGEWANTTYVGLNLDYKYNSKNDPNNYYQRSDHYNFAKNNVPVIFYFNGTHADYHKESDTVDKINWEQLESRTRLVFYTAWHLANEDSKPELNAGLN